MVTIVSVFIVEFYSRVFNMNNPTNQNIENVSKDVASLILDDLDSTDCENFSMCSLTCYKLCDEKYFHNRALRMYPLTIRRKKQNTWRKHVLETESYIKLLNDQYNHEYYDSSDRNPRLLYKARELVRQVGFDFFSVALVEACRIGNLELVQYLVERGADVNFSDGYPIKYTAHSGRSEAQQFEILKYLVENGDNVKISDLSNHVLSIACSRNRFEFVKYLVENGANINVENGIPFKFACEIGNLEMVKYLVEKGVDIPNDGQAISRAIRKGHTAVVEYLNSLNN